MSSAEQVQVLVISPDEELEPDPDSTDKLSELTEDESPMSPFEDIEPEPEPEEDNQAEFTAESESQESTESEQFSTKSNRELKSILALAKEANLDTNIAHKRKSVEPTKTEPDGIDSPKKPSAVKKLKSTEESDENVEEDTVCNKVTKRKRDSINEKPTGGASEDKRSKKEIAPDLSMLKIKKDAFCWRCHKNGVGLSCETCPRSYHVKCIKLTQTVHWQCPECISVLKAESTKTRSPAMKDIDLEHLCSLLKYAHKRMMQISDSEPFMHPVNEKEFPDYQSYIIRPMDLTKLGKNIQANIYGSTNAFEADTKWILHNSIIFNSFICPDQSKLTTTAKAIVKVCKQEMSEIENCSNCYRNANTITEWFVEVCPKPHLLLWAKLKGFPYWPAKAMSVTSSGMVDVRFFGAHDRAWVSYKDCFLYSAKNPNANQMKKNDINECVKEVEVYIENLKKIYGVFKYAPYKTPYDPSAENLQIFLPKYSPKGIKPSPVKSPGSTSLTKSEDFEKTPEIDDTDEDSRDLIIDSNVGHVTGDSQIFEVSILEQEDEQEFPDSPKSKKRSRNSSTETSTKVPKLDVKKFDVNKPSEVDNEVDSENQLTSSVKKDANKLRISDKLFLKLSKKDKKEGNETMESDKVEYGVDIKKAEKPADIKKSELPLPPLVPISKTRKMEYEENDLLEVMYTEPVEIQNHKDEEKMVKEQVEIKSKEKDVESETEIDLSEDSEQEEVNEDPLELNESTLDSVKNYLASHKKVKAIITSESKDSIKINDVKITKVSNNKNSVDEALINDVPKGCLERLKAGSVVIEKKTEQKPANSGISTPELRKSTEEVSKKRKASTDSKESDSSRKNLRVVSVEDLVESGSESVQSLLEKQLKNVPKADKSENKEAPKFPKKLPEKVNSEITDPASPEKIHDAREVCFVDIKNEPLSDEEADHDLMAAKRKLLSALNISEKLPTSKMPTTAAKPEIRTRSKTDEKAMKFRITDNLSQVIDKVASDYTKENGSVTMKKNEKKPKNSIKQRARKSFPSPRTPPTQIKIAKKSIPITSTKTVSSAANTVTVQANTSVTATPTTVINSPSVMAQCNPPTNMMILPQSLVLPQNPSLTYSSANPLITMVPHSGTSYANIILPQNQNFLPNINLAPFNVINNPVQAPQMTAPQEATETTNSVTTVAHTLPTEITLLNGVYPENISRAMTEVLCKFPPKLKPRPPGPLGQVFEESAPSSVGPITAHVNSVAHRLTDYFRGMLIETLCDVGKTEGNPEGTIANLRLELETLKHKHSEEILEIKKNVNTILQDIQKSVNEEKDKIVQETRAACELETLRRVEEAKSKQWCAMCLKEAQFYCCWNTSYCDYPCQTKHWPKHMSKCTQNSASQNQQNINLVPGMSTQPIILRPTAPPKGMGKVLGKTTKLIVNKSGNKMPLNIVKTTPQNTITLVESTPGKYEISVENSKMLNCPRFLNKIKSVVSSAVSSTPTSASTTLIIQQNQSAKSSTSNGSAETN